MHPIDVFGETMMLVYYGYAVPLSLKIGRGFYQDGIWADAGFIPYSRIGGRSRAGGAGGRAAALALWPRRPLPAGAPAAPRAFRGPPRRRRRTGRPHDDAFHRR